jgi:hypothetical protein
MFLKNSQLVIRMKLDQKPDGTATLKVGPKFLETKTRPPGVTNTYDIVLSMAQSMKALLHDLGFHVAADDRFTARVLGIAYYADQTFQQAA